MKYSTSNVVKQSNYATEWCSISTRDCHICMDSHTGQNMCIMAVAWFHMDTSPLHPAEHPCWQHLSCRPIWMGPLQPSQQSRAVCTSAVCRPGPWGRVCHHHCLLHQRTAQLACSHLCFQVCIERRHMEKGFGDSNKRRKVLVEKGWPAASTVCSSAIIMSSCWIDQWWQTTFRKNKCLHYPVQSMYWRDQKPVCISVGVMYGCREMQSVTDDLSLLPIINSCFHSLSYSWLREIFFFFLTQWSPTTCNKVPSEATCRCRTVGTHGTGAHWCRDGEENERPG